MLTRITFSNYGILDQMFFDESELDAIESFWALFGSFHVPRNTGGIRVISIGEAMDESDCGGWIIGTPLNATQLNDVA